MWYLAIPFFLRYPSSLVAFFPISFLALGFVEYARRRHNFLCYFYFLLGGLREILTAVVGISNFCAALFNTETGILL